MEKRNFVLLCNLLDVTYEDEKAEDNIKWKLNVLQSVGKDGYCIADVGGRYVEKQFSTDEIEFADVACYNFMGSALEQERFYSADFITVKEKATGDLYALETEGIYEF